MQSAAARRRPAGSSWSFIRAPQARAHICHAYQRDHTTEERQNEHTCKNDQQDTHSVHVAVVMYDLVVSETIANRICEDLPIHQLYRRRRAGCGMRGGGTGNLSFYLCKSGRTTAAVCHRVQLLLFVAIPLLAAALPHANDDSLAGRVTTPAATRTSVGRCRSHPSWHPPSSPSNS